MYMCHVHYMRTNIPLACGTRIGPPHAHEGIRRWNARDANAFAGVGWQEGAHEEHVDGQVAGREKRVNGVVEAFKIGPPAVREDKVGVASTLRPALAARVGREPPR